MRHLRNTNILRETPAEARGHLDFSEVTELGELGQARPDVALGAGLFHAATAAVAIRYATSAASEDDPTWMIMSGWLVGIYAAYRGMVVIGENLGFTRK
jgi:hypothetical protein